MKQWKKPELNMLGVKNTFEEVELMSAWGSHYCHSKSEYHSGNCSAGKGHKGVKVGACEEHKTGIIGEMEYSCCCLS